MQSRISEYLRANVLGLVAIFLALNAGAYAVTQADRDREQRAKGSENSVGANQLDINSVNRVLQARVDGQCGKAQSIRRIRRNGEVLCSHRMDPEPVAPESAFGTVKSVDSGFGLTGGPITESGTLAADPTVLQRRIADSCSTNHAVQSVAEDGTVGCNPFVRQVSAGSGLSGAPITDTGALSVDTTQIQSRVGGTCGGSQAVQSVAQNGNVTCSPSFARGSGSVLTSGVFAIAEGQTQTLLSANGVSVLLDCSNGTDAKVVLKEDPGNAGNALATSVSLAFTVAGGPTFDGNAPPPNNQLTIGSTTANDRGDFNVGQSTGPDVQKTLDGSFSAFKFGPLPPTFPDGGCVASASGIAS